MWTLSRHRRKLTFRQSRSQLELLVLERTVALEKLSQRLLRVQDEERRRLARDLHDSTGQILTALKISVALLQKREVNGEGIREELSGIELLADDALQEIRTTSYLLHPPMLDEAGFTSAAQWFVKGFAQRTQMQVRIHFPPQAERLPDTIEIALFRMLQESLTNVHRHSGSSEVDVRFLREDHAVILEVRDFGCGIPEKLLRRLGQSVQDSGVGLAGMCERLNELKGDLEITSANPGTRLRAIVPLAPVVKTEETLHDRAAWLVLMRSILAAWKRAKRTPVNVGRWGTAVGLAAVLLVGAWIGFRDRHPSSIAGVSGLHETRPLDPQSLPFAAAQEMGENNVQPALGRGTSAKGDFQTHLRAPVNENVRVRYFSDDVTVRYFTPQNSPQQVPGSHNWVRLSDDVTVRYFKPEPAVGSSSAQKGNSARSAER